jgi:hypothetical protein
MIKWVRHVACMVKRNSYRIFVSNISGMKQAGSPRRTETELDWIPLGHDGVEWQDFVDTVMKIWFITAGNFFTT